ncbi:MAG: triose-phosphate isomerase [Piscirickettsiaceae bacterium]|nr:MAG: triose-phosphate isomerase [Piscirickettsiaceae bacterium]PCI68121.1 MAG: triose-phosphate isomerase [Piscirickettsiaceae bacterium]
MRKPLVIGNWKMNGSVVLASELIQSIGAGIDDKISCEVGLCVPFVYLKSAVSDSKQLSISIGAQTVSEFSQGAYTGEISADMLSEIGCKWVLVGHSERRQYFNETGVQLVLKVKAAQQEGLAPVFCVGETEKERQDNQTFEVIKRQLMELLSDEGVDLNNIVLAYEPVWAIGTGLTASPEEAQAVHAYIRELVASIAGDVATKMRILYGGSVKADNAQSLFNQQDIDGGLIGGASLNAEAFLTICRHAK